MSHPLFSLLERLDFEKYSYQLSRNGSDSVLVTITFVGERLEVDVFDDGHMEVSRFKGNEDIEGGEELVYRIIEENVVLDG